MDGIALQEPHMIEMSNNIMINGVHFDNAHDGSSGRVVLTDKAHFGIPTGAYIEFTSDTPIRSKVVRPEG